MSKKIDNLLQLNYIGHVNQDMDNQLLSNGFWVVEHLEEPNQPDFISLEKDKLLFKTCFDKDRVELNVGKEDNIAYTYDLSMQVLQEYFGQVVILLLYLLIEQQVK